jgi:lipoprotein-anchoring transpeptidase ErfK/SrfK
MLFMKKLVLFVAISCLILLGAAAAEALDIFQDYDKVIFINQPRQTGTAYEHGKKVREFPVLTGDDESTTDPGIYVIRVKVADYYSRTYDTPMPYSLFFDWRRRKAIHEGGVPVGAEKGEVATHGCIHVESPHMEWLYEWAEEGATALVVSGERSAD